ncbi:MAG: aminotransferase class V-fold PLP-dependent enzyme, partial [Christensenellales bacterium]
MIYLDNAATTRFKPTAVKCAVLRELCRPANPGRSSHDESIRAGILVEKCRDEIKKRFFDGNVVFTKNCTEALNLAIFGSNPSRQVVATVYEHNSVLRPLKKLADDGKITLKLIDHSDENSLLRALRTPTSLVVMTAMSNVTGKAFDISSLSKLIKSESDAKILVDCAQSAGHVKTDLTYVDMCAFAGHKSLHGPQGTGFLLLRDDVRLTARLLGGTGTSSLDIRHPNTIPEGMEAGTLNTPGIAGLYEGIKWTMNRI